MRTTVDLPPAVHRRALEIARSTGRSLSAVPVHALPGCEFWPDSLSYAASDLVGVRGHRQVTDAYLVSLAAAGSNAKLATLDEGLVQSQPERTLLVPAAG